MRESESKRWMAIGWRFLVWFALLAWLMLVGTACEHRDLTYYEVAEITINTDWSKAGLPDEEAVYGATVLFYPAEGGKSKIVLMGNRASSKTRMEVGQPPHLNYKPACQESGYTLSPKHKKRNYYAV